MDKYVVKLYPQAVRDIDEIYEYIAVQKMSPENARRQTNRIWDALSDLETMPSSHQDRLEGRYAGQGYKQFLIDNYIAIYKIDEQSKTVFVVTLQYYGRNL